MVSSVEVEFCKYRMMSVEVIVCDEEKSYYEDLNANYTEMEEVDDFQLKEQ